jgi:hypothetical protein
MSFLNSAYATPSRLRGIYRCVLKSPKQTVSRETLLKLVTPEAMLKAAGKENSGMSNAALLEGLKVGLFLEQGDDIILNPSLPKACLIPATGDAALPEVLAQLMVHGEENHDFALMGAWYLAQDTLRPLGNWKTVEDTMIRQFGGPLFKMTNARFGQFEDWFCFLGLGWVQGGTGVVPDPTAFLRRQLPSLFDQGIGMERPIGQLMADLAERWPIFEGGSIRRETDPQAPKREPQALSTATAVALFRLQLDGMIRLDYRSDAQGLQLPKGDTYQAFTHVTLQKA